MKVLPFRKVLPVKPDKVMAGASILSIVTTLAGVGYLVATSDIIIGLLSFGPLMAVTFSLWYALIHSAKEVLS